MKETELQPSATLLGIATRWREYGWSLGQSTLRRQWSRNPIFKVVVSPSAKADGVVLCCDMAWPCPSANLLPSAQDQIIRVLNTERSNRAIRSAEPLP